MTGPKRLRLLHVTVHPVYVIDDGESLTQTPAEPITVTAKDWPRLPETLELDRLRAEESLAESATTDMKEDAQ